MTPKERITLFLLFCIPIRLYIAYLPQIITKENLKKLGYVLMGIGLSFFYLFITKKRLNAPEGGGETWWAEYRPIHGTLYLIAAYTATQGYKETSYPLLIDALFGLYLGMKKHNLIN